MKFNWQKRGTKLAVIFSHLFTVPCGFLA